MRFKKFAAVALSVALATASMPISGLAAGEWYEGVSIVLEPDASEILLGDSVELAVDYTRTSTSSNAEKVTIPSDSDAKINWTITDGNLSVENGVVTANKYDMKNAEANKATVTATLAASSSVNGTATVEIAAPELKVPATLAVSPTQDVSIKPELGNVKEGLEAKYTYTSSAPETIKVSAGGMVTADNAEVGAEATITVTAAYNETVFAEEKVAVTVVEKVPGSESLVWAETAQIPVRLVVGGEYSIPFKSTYNDGFKVVSDNEKIATVAVSEEKDPADGLLYVKVAAVAEGTANITLSHEGAVDLTSISTFGYN